MWRLRQPNVADFVELIPHSTSTFSFATAYSVIMPQEVIRRACCWSSVSVQVCMRRPRIRVVVVEGRVRPKSHIACRTYLLANVTA